MNTQANDQQSTGWRKRQINNATSMTVLPSEINRCRPVDPSPRCANCRRWADHPDQPVGSIARVVNTTGAKDPACVYIAISLLEAA